jgi:tripartite motif-containing protein 71
MARTIFPTILALTLLAAAQASSSAPYERGPEPLVPASGDTVGGIAMPGRLRIEETGIRYGTGELREPVGIAVDALGFVYVADAMAGKVFRFDASGSLEFSRPREEAGFYPIDIAVQESFIFVLDYAGNRLLRYDAEGAYLDVLFSFAALDERPVSLTSGAGGRLITTDLLNDTVELWTPLLEPEISIGGFGRTPGSFSDPRKAAFLPRHEIVVVESGNGRIQLFSPSGRYERTAGEGEFVFPRCVSADAQGTIFVCDPDGKRLAMYSSDLEHIADIDSDRGAPIAPAAAAPGWDGKLYVADLVSRSIIVYRLIYSSDK